MRTSNYEQKQKAWQRVGRDVASCLTVKEVIEKAGLNYEVALCNDYGGITLANEKGGKYTHFTKFNRSKKTYRTDNNVILGTVGNNYTVIQNSEAFNFFDELIGEGIEFERAGFFGDGERIFVAAKLPAHIKVKGDTIESYLYFTSSHDMTIPCYIGFTPIRSACWNIMPSLIKSIRGVSKDRIVIKHTKNAERINEAHRVLAISNSLVDEANKIFNRFAEVKLTDDEALDYFNSVFTVKKKDGSDADCRIANEVLEYYKNDPTQNTEACKGTLFGAYSAVTGHLNHRDYMNSEVKLRSVMHGHARITSVKAFKRAVIVAK